ncbi:MAG: DUF3987 domain-containing protein [Phycisphaerales bacterium]|jgi:putative DNA primase/helicase|nr:DUF3987 domain-containing protein [Phycisphaerales bacterium]
MNNNKRNNEWPTCKQAGKTCPQCGNADRCTIAPDGRAGKCWRDGGEVWRAGNGQAHAAGQSRSAGDGGKKIYASAILAIEAIERSTGGKRVKDWTYRDASGNEVAKIVRLTSADGKQYRPIHRHKSGWCIGDPAEKWPLYRRDKLPADGPIYICEGEKCADIAAGLGLATVASAHGSSSASKSDWSPLAGRNVVILPDADEPGRKYAADVSRLLLSLDRPASVKVVTLPGLPAGGDIEQFLADGGTREDMLRIAGEVAPVPAGFDWPEPKPLPNGLPTVHQFDYDLLPESLRDWARDVSERMQCPPEFAAVAMLASAGSLIGRKIAIRPKQYDDWTEVPNLWALLIGSPSAMKSPTRREALRTIYHLQAEAGREYAAAVNQYDAHQLLMDAEKKAFKAKLNELIKDGKREEAEELAASMAAAEKQEGPTERVYVVNDCTVEALGVVLNQNPNGVLLDRDEIIGWLKTMDRDGHENDRGFYLAAWGGLDRYEYRRIGRGTVAIESTTLSIIGTIQPGVYADYIRLAIAGGMGADGLSQRFQLAVWPDTPNGWTNVDRYPDPEAKSKAHDAMKRLADLTPGDVEAQRDGYERSIPFLRFNDDAQLIFDKWHADLMRHCRSGVDHPAIESHLLKMKSTVPSLALIFHLLDGGVGPVSVEAIQRAVAWSKFLESHARRIYAVVGSAPAIAAGQLARRLLAGELESPFTARDIYNRGWAGLDRQSVYLALDVLASAKWLSEVDEPTGGRPKTIYRTNPKISIFLGDGTSKTSKSPPDTPFDPFAGSPSYKNENFSGGKTDPEPVQGDDNPSGDWGTI